MRIERRYCGPPASAHGGVSVGRFAELVGPGPVEVRLMGPPPLDTDLDFRAEDGGTVVVSGPDGDLARVRSLDEPIAVEPFALVTDAEIEDAAAAYLEDVSRDGHPFPTCFGCGPEREEGDGLRQFTGAVSDGDTTAARFFVGGSGPLPAWMCWAGLDCPSAGAVTALSDRPPAVVVLGTMSGQVEGEVRAGVEYQVRGRYVGSDGRKHTSEVAMLAPDGSAVGAARAVWIAIDPNRL